MTKYSLLFLLFFNVSCAKSHLQTSRDAVNSLQVFSGFEKIYIGSDPDRISVRGRYKAKMDNYSEPISFRFHTLVYLHNSGINNTVAGCGASLGTNAKKPREFQTLKEPFEELALVQIGNSGAGVTTTGDMLFSIVWEISDVPKSLTKNAPTNFCLVRTRVEIGERFLDENTTVMESSPSLPPQKNDPLFDRDLMYFVSSGRLREVMEIELNEHLTMVLPVLTGKVTDQCALFQADPVDECTRTYSREILIQEEALRCATENHEKTKIVSEIQRLENKLKSMSSDDIDFNAGYKTPVLC